MTTSIEPRTHSGLPIGGRWAPAAAGGTREILNPATGAVLATVPEGTPEDV